MKRQILVTADLLPGQPCDALTALQLMALHMKWHTFHMKLLSVEPKQKRANVPVWLKLKKKRV